MRAALADARPRSRAPWVIGLGILVIAGGIGLAASHTESAAPMHTEPTKIAAIEPAHALSPDAVLMGCVGGLDGAVARHASIGGACLTAIRTQANDPTLGPDVHDTLAIWLAAESDLAADKDGALGTRDALTPTIHKVIRADFTR
jgi:hypothetical protein